MLPNQPIIGTLKIRTRRSDGAALRLDVERQLAANALTVRHLGPAAILLIRRLEDPLPNRLREPAWHRAVKDRIDSLYAQAARPSRGRVDARCDALLFADEAEMLACLALDMSGFGDPASWWRRAIARYLRHGSVRALFAERMRLLPAAFAQLAQWHSLEAVIRTLGDEDALALCVAFAAENELRPVQKVLDLCRGILSAAGANPTLDSGLPLRDADAGSLAVMALGRQSRTDAPLPSSRAATRVDSWIPAGCKTLGIAQQLLIAAVIGFRFAPAQLAAPGLAIELRRWLVARSRSLSASRGPDPESTPESPKPATSRGDPARSREIAPPVRTPASDNGSAVDPRVDDRTETRRDDSRVEELSLEMDADARLDGIETGIAGIFYLMNVMEHLRLPECFEEQCQLASSVGTLGTLEALARVLAGTRREELALDPIWAILAQLDGRETYKPPRADGLRTPGRLPAEWLEQLGGVAPVRRESDALAIEALRKAGWPAPLLDWLDLVMPFIGWRTARACALDSVDEAVQLLIELPARVYVTASHIDVVTSIENIRVPVRLAGLDRSPGWVRSMQRVVLFHFE